MKGKNYMQVSRLLIRDLENLNSVSFGRESCDIVFNHIKQRDDHWIAEIEKLERQVSELEKELEKSYAPPAQEPDEEWLNKRYQVYVPGEGILFHVADDNGGTLCGASMADVNPNEICDKCETIKAKLLNV